MMTPERWQQIKQIFYAAQERDGDKRVAFLVEACAGDESLQREVESLLASHVEAEDFIESPAFDPAAADATLNEKLIGQRIGPYRIIREVGRGGMGVVFEAARDDAEFQQRVALKLIRRGLDTTDILRRFRNERQILAALSHPHIAHLVDGGSTSDGLPYFVMEFIEGLPLLAYCDHNQLRLEERIGLFRKVCDAVAHAHRNLIIHRDLKPSNILVTNEGEPKLLDFGVAKLWRPDPVEQMPETRTALRVMTPEYASPEQVRGLRVTTATDIYSLGVVLYELLTGVKPYKLKTKSPEELSRAICESEPSKPSVAVSQRLSEISGRRNELRTTDGEANPQFAIRNSKFLRGDLDTIILMALRKEPQRRYATVEQFSEDLRRHLDGLPVIARPDTFGYRATKFLARNKAGVAAAALVILALIAGLLATLWQARVARSERDRAHVAQAKAERINRFLQDALGAPDPNKEGRDIKVVDVLDRAAQRAQTELANQPEVLAEVQRTIGVTYYNLEQYEKAEPLLRSALRIFIDTLGENNATTANCMRDLCNLLSYQEKSDEAIPLLLRTIAIYQQLPPEYARDLANTKYSLAQAYQFKGDMKSAQPLLREILDFAARNFGAKDTLVAEAANDLANTLRDKEYEAAINLYRQAAEIIRLLPSQRSNLGTCLSNLGYTLTSAGRYDEAETVLNESLAIRRELYGEKSPSLAVSLVNMSRLHFHRGDFARAESEARHAIEMQAGLPKGHRNFGRSYLALGSALMRTGKLPEAERYLRDAIEIFQRQSDHENRSLAVARGMLGECLLMQNRRTEAEPLINASHQSLKSSLGDSDPATIEAYNRLSLLKRK